MKTKPLKIFTKYCETSSRHSIYKEMQSISFDAANKLSTVAVVKVI